MVTGTMEAGRGGNSVEEGHGDRRAWHQVLTLVATGAH